MKPTELDFEIRRVRSNERVIEEGIAVGDETHYATLVMSEPAIDRFKEEALDEETVAFLEGTTLPDQPLLIVQYHLPSISLKLKLESIRRADDESLRVRVITVGEYLLEESITETVIARLSLVNRPTPETAEITLTDRDHEYKFRTDE